jgi:hypothetical protein
MALAGYGAICIWNDITADGRDDFYAWHIAEHMPERVGIPGFRRGRRYIASAAETSPEFFTLYETDGPEVHVGQAYLNRLNNPTPWTRRVMPAFRRTSRALTRVRASFGQGPGGILATLRFAVRAGGEEAVARALAADILPKVAPMPQITGAHLCLTDQAASGTATTESRSRTDSQAAPSWVVLIEGCNLAPVERAVAAILSDSGFVADGPATTGFYRLEHTRLKAASVPG